VCSDLACVLFCKRTRQIDQLITKGRGGSSSFQSEERAEGRDVIGPRISGRSEMVMGS